MKGIFQALNLAEGFLKNRGVLSLARKNGICLIDSMQFHPKSISPIVLLSGFGGMKSGGGGAIGLGLLISGSSGVGSEGSSVEGLRDTIFGGQTYRQRNSPEAKRLTPKITAETAIRAGREAKTPTTQPASPKMIPDAREVMRARLGVKTGS